MKLWKMLLTSGAGLLACAGQSYTTWSDYGGSTDSMQYSALKRIDTHNVTRLEQAWSAEPESQGYYVFALR